MLTQDTKFRLVHAVTDQKIADEIEKRITIPAAYTQQGFQDKLATLDRSLDAAIRERLVGALAGDDRGAAGRQIADQIDAIVTLAEALADGAEVPEVPGEIAFFEGQVAGMTTDVRIEADDVGAGGNAVLEANGVTEINVLIEGWNLANPSNTISLISGDGAQVPDEDIVLAGGSDAVPAQDANSAPAIAALQKLQTVSAKTAECLTAALTDTRAAQEMKTKIEDTIEWYLD